MEAVGGIPVVGVLHKFWKVACSVPTYLFMKKMIRFLAELKDISPEDRQSQIARLDVVPGEKERVGETLLLLLDRLNDMQKPAMVGRAFKAFLEGKITSEQFRSMTHAIDALSVSHLAALDSFYRYSAPAYMMGAKILKDSPFSDTKERNTPLQGLAMCGLVSIDWRAETKRMRAANLDGGSSEVGFDAVVAGEIAYMPNHLGRLFWKTILSAS